MDPRDVPDVEPRGSAGLPDFGAGIGLPHGIPGGDPSPDAAPLVAPPPPPEPPTPMPVGGLISPPRRIVYVPPVYSSIAQAARVEGTVIIQAIIDTSGAVSDVRVLRSVGLLDQAAIDAVRKWKYTPTRLNGMPVPVIMTVTVTFRLNDL